MCVYIYIQAHFKPLVSFDAATASPLLAAMLLHDIFWSERERERERERGWEREGERVRTGEKEQESERVREREEGGGAYF